MRRYEIVCEALEDVCFGKAKVYGIDGFDDFGNLCFHIGSVTYDFEVAKRLTKLMNENDVSFINAKDVIRDYIYGIFCR